MEPHVFVHASTQEDFVQAGVSYLVDAIAGAIDQNGQCTMGLSGGSTPRAVYEALGRSEEVDWSNVTVFLADERYINVHDPDSNQFLLESTLFTGMKRRPRTVMPDTSLPLEECVQAYADALENLLLDTPADIVTLGMGSDGHISSLFPPLGKEAFGPAMAIHTQTEQFPIRDRISVTLPVIQDADSVLWMLKGSDKRRVWDTMMKSEEDVARWPGKSVLERGNSTVIGWW